MNVADLTAILVPLHLEGTQICLACLLFLVGVGKGCHWSHGAQIRVRFPTSPVHLLKLSIQCDQAGSGSHRQAGPIPVAKLLHCNVAA